jgi:1-acyl-sn-glycerol-3-phosphate acyltransferase
MLDACRHALDNGLSVMLFPEGTRSRDGNLRPFKDGAFELAVEKKLAVLPLAIAGTEGCLHHGVRLGRARAIVRVLEPIAIEGSGEAEVARVRDLARVRIEAGMRELEAKLRAK